MDEEQLPPLPPFPVLPGESGHRALWARWAEEYARAAVVAERYRASDLTLDLLVSAGHIGRELAFQVRDIVNGNPPYDAAAIRGHAEEKQ
jgi:hypothetical protein